MKPLHLRLIAAGIPVVVCTPHRHYADCSPDCEDEITPPKAWQRMTADVSKVAILKYRPGVDTLGMVGGHGIDVLDIDTKAGGCPDSVPANLQMFGRTRTPSGGVHYPVPSTGYGKGDLFIGGVYQGDYVGGTKDGGSRLMAFLPGSTRPKYPGLGYVEEEPWDIDALLAAQPGPTLLEICAESGLATEGAAGTEAATSDQAAAFLADHSEAVDCGYGRRQLAEMLKAADDIVAGDEKRGRHPWASRSMNWAVDLMKAGCLDATAYTAIAARLEKVKPGSKREADALLCWAISNTLGKTTCDQHDPFMSEFLGELATFTPVVDMGSIDPGVPEHVDPETGEILEPPDLEARVFGATPELAYLLQLARAQMVGPWALLGAAVALVLAQTRPFLRIPAYIGTEASLNFFLAIVDASGGGKTIGVDVACQAIPAAASGAARRNPSSGEGIITLFVDVNSKGEQSRTATRVLSVVDEVATLGAQQDRAGSTLASILRSVWSGSAVSTHAADKSRRRDLEAHSYRFVMMTGVQPATAAVLLDDMGGGTPQRFLWMPAGDPRAPDEDVPRPDVNPFDSWRVPASRKVSASPTRT